MKNKKKKKTNRLAIGTRRATAFDQRANQASFAAPVFLDAKLAVDGGSATHRGAVGLFVVLHALVAAALAHARVASGAFDGRAQHQRTVGLFLLHAHIATALFGARVAVLALDLRAQHCRAVLVAVVLRTHARRAFGALRERHAFAVVTRRCARRRWTTAVAVLIDERRRFALNWFVFHTRMTTLCSHAIKTRFKKNPRKNKKHFVTPCLTDL